jgi:LuxR family transcriptional regulator, maltose regulon positive regulatory protein
MVSAQAQAPLLATKLYPPDPRDRLGRRVLLERLSGASRARLVLIRAPAGWGKSTLLSQWRIAEAGRREFAWVTLDRRDSDPVRFWTYVIESLRRIAAGVGTGPLPLLGAPGVDLEAEMLPVLVDELGDLPAPVVVALDDYHLIEGDTVHATVRALLEYLPGTVTVAIATRSEPPLPIPRLRARGLLIDVDVRALQFSAEESDMLLNGMLGLGLGDAEVRHLHDRTEGWPAGLYLAALSLGDRADRDEFVAGFAGTDRHIVDYLMEEVLLAQQPAVRDFMLRSSVLERMSGPLCDAVVGRDDSAAMLDRLARSNLFFVELDDRRDWYRYHHLLQACLTAELQRSEPDLVAELHRRAAAWHLDSGEVSDAVHHTIAAGDHDEARELIARYWAPMMMVTAGERTVEEWFAALPDAVIERDLRLCVARSYIGLSMGRMDVVARWMRAAETAPLPAPFYDGFSSARGAIACVRAGYYWQTGDVGAAMAAAQDVLAAEGPESPWRGIGLAVVGLTHAAHAEWDRARASVDAWAEIGRAAGQLVPQISGLANAAAWSTELGDWERAASSADAALRLAAEHGYQEHWICAGAHFTTARLLERAGTPGDAKPHMRRALELARRGAGPVTTAWLLTHLVRLLVMCDDPAGARMCLEEARAALAAAHDAAGVGSMVAAAEQQLDSATRSRASHEGLSDRELDVLRLLATDLTQREIGQQLYLSFNTVKSHSRSIFRKLGVSGREEAVARARSLGLI